MNNQVSKLEKNGKMKRWMNSLFFTVFKLECSISNYKQFLFSRPLVYLPLTLLHVILCWTGLRDICFKVSFTSNTRQPRLCVTVHTCVTAVLCRRGTKNNRISYLEVINSERTPPNAFTPMMTGKLALMRSLLIILFSVNSNCPIRSSYLSVNDLSS